MKLDMPIDICITTWKREWMTSACLRSLELNTRTPHRLIIVDNGSDPGFQSNWLCGTADVYIKLDHNQGLEYAKHLAMKFVKSPLFVSMDNDIMVYHYPNCEEDWLSRLISLMAKHPEYKAIAPKPQILVGTGMYMFETEEEIVPFHHVPGYARLMDTQCVRETGAWNGLREGRGHEELWIGDEFSKRGWKMGWANKVECWHLFGNEKTDDWGYDKYSDPASHGHHPVFPMPKNDADIIMEKTGININD